MSDWEERAQYFELKCGELEEELRTLREQVSDAEWDWEKAGVFKKVDPWDAIRQARRAEDLATIRVSRAASEKEDGK